MPTGIVMQVKNFQVPKNLFLQIIFHNFVIEIFRLWFKVACYYFLEIKQIIICFYSNYWNILLQ